MNTPYRHGDARPIVEAFRRIRALNVSPDS